MTEHAVNRGDLDRLLKRANAAGQPIEFVPTMGALHRGHRSLIERASAAGGFVVVSIFVNPLQFSEASDLVGYPRSLESDLDLATESGASLVYAPAVEELLPLGRSEQQLDPGPVGRILEGAARPGHFAGVATIVARLFEQVGPRRAYFGEKDFQQLLIVRRLVESRAWPIEIVACPTIREPDGLAASSRNARLSTSERAAAPGLYRALRAGEAAILDGDRSPAGVEAAMAGVLAEEPLIEVDYAAIARSSDLSRPEVLVGELRLLVAARLGAVRLIDNLGITI